MLQDVTNYLTEITGLGANAIQMTMLGVSVALVGVVVVFVLKHSKKKKRRRYR